MWATGKRINDKKNTILYLFHWDKITCVFFEFKPLDHYEWSTKESLLSYLIYVYTTCNSNSFSFSIAKRWSPEPLREA